MCAIYADVIPFRDGLGHDGYTLVGDGDGDNDEDDSEDNGGGGGGGGAVPGSSNVYTLATVVETAPTSLLTSSGSTAWRSDRANAERTTRSVQYIRVFP